MELTLAIYLDGSEVYDTWLDDDPERLHIVDLFAQLARTYCPTDRHPPAPSARFLSFVENLLNSHGREWLAAEHPCSLLMRVMRSIEARVVKYQVERRWTNRQFLDRWSFVSRSLHEKDEQKEETTPSPRRFFRWLTALLVAVLFVEGASATDNNASSTTMIINQPPAMSNAVVIPSAIPSAAPSAFAEPSLSVMGGLIIPMGNDTQSLQMLAQEHAALYGSNKSIQRAKFILSQTALEEGGWLDESFVDKRPTLIALAYDLSSPRDTSKRINYHLQMVRVGQNATVALDHTSSDLFSTQHVQKWLDAQRPPKMTERHFQKLSDTLYEQYVMFCWTSNVCLMIQMDAYHLVVHDQATIVDELDSYGLNVAIPTWLLGGEEGRAQHILEQMQAVNADMVVREIDKPSVLAAIRKLMASTDRPFERILSDDRRRLNHYAFSRWSEYAKELTIADAVALMRGWKDEFVAKDDQQNMFERRTLTDRERKTLVSLLVMNLDDQQQSMVTLQTRELWFVAFDPTDPPTASRIYDYFENFLVNQRIVHQVDDNPNGFYMRALDWFSKRVIDKAFVSSVAREIAVTKYVFTNLLQWVEAVEKGDRVWDMVDAWVFLATRTTLGYLLLVFGSTSFCLFLQFFVCRCCCIGCSRQNGGGDCQSKQRRVDVAAAGAVATLERSPNAPSVSAAPSEGAARPTRLPTSGRTTLRRRPLPEFVSPRK